LITKDLPACTDLLFINCHQTAILRGTADRMRFLTPLRRKS